MNILRYWLCCVMLFGLPKLNTGQKATGKLLNHLTIKDIASTSRQFLLICLPLFMAMIFDFTQLNDLTEISELSTHWRQDHDTNVQLRCPQSNTSWSRHTPSRHYIPVGWCPSLLMVDSLQASLWQMHIYIYGLYYITLFCFLFFCFCFLSFRFVQIKLLTSNQTWSLNNHSWQICGPLRRTGPKLMVMAFLSNNQRWESSHELDAKGHIF